MSLQVARYQLSVAQYERMIEAGVFPEDARIELIEGELLEMTPIGTRHMAVVNRLTRILSRGVGDRAVLSVQNPIQLDERSVPQPDLALLCPQPDDYEQRRPTPADVLLLVEVAEPSVAYDRERKAELYARAGVAEYWVVDLTTNEIVAWRQPVAGRYQVERVARRGDSLSPAALLELTVTVAEVLR